jgi:uncharacterized protein (DUF2132 family)
MGTVHDVRHYQEVYHSRDFQEPVEPSKPKDKAYAVKRDKQLQRLQERIEHDWMASGIIIREFHDEPDLWRSLGFKTFAAWVEARTGHRADYAYKCMRISQQLSHLPAEQLSSMTMENATTLAKLPPDMRTDEVVEMAQTLPNKELEDKLEEKHPGVKDPEGSTRHTWRFPASFELVYKDAIADARRNPNVDNDLAALEYIISHWKLCPNCNPK